MQDSQEQSIEGALEMIYNVSTLERVLNHRIPITEIFNTRDGRMQYLKWTRERKSGRNIALRLGF